MSFEPTEEQISRILESNKRQHLRRTELYLARKRGEAPPAHTPHRTFFPRTYAHRILIALDANPEPSTKLGAGTEFGKQHIAAQILRLQELGLIEWNPTGTFFITEKGQQALERLNAKESYTMWLG